MKYRNARNGQPISILGYGCMRLSRKGGNIDLDKAEKELLEAYHSGVNYFDTAYLYPGNEAALGEIIKRNGIREKINIATKLPQYLVGNIAAVDKYFNEELSRLQTDYIDFYLMHFMTGFQQWEKLKTIGIESWIEEKKRSGQIRNIGFSFHGNTDNFVKILNAYDWDSCLIQYNYLDENSQAGKNGLKAAAEKGVSVMIMEPLRGGKLVNLLPEKAKELIKNDPSGFTPAELSFRWLWNQPEVTCVLSGMNSLEMVRENCRVASEMEAGSLTPENLELVRKVRALILESTKVGCTECRYCMPCPRGVDIPGIFRSYNRMYTENKISGWREFFQTVMLGSEPAAASNCIQCGKCEQHCPQGIHIREELKNADKKIRPFFLKPVYPIARKFMLKGSR